MTPPAATVAGMGTHDPLAGLHCRMGGDPACDHLDRWQHTTAPEPELVTIIRRLADLEAIPAPVPAEMRELNMLRIRLGDSWPEVFGALAHAYMSMNAQE